MKSNSK